MKNLIIISSIIVLNSIRVLSQQDTNFVKGTFIIGGNTSFEYLVDGTEIQKNDPKDFSLDLSPQVGYFFVNRLALGIDLTYRLNIDNRENGLSDYENTFFLKPFLRYYFLKNMFLYANTGKGLGYVKEYDLLSEDGYYNYKIQYSDFNLGIGYSIFLKEGMAFEILAKYYVEKKDSEVYFISQEKIDGINLSIGLQIFLNQHEK